MDIVICPRIEMGSPAAETSRNPGGDVLSLRPDVRFLVTNEIDDPESIINLTTVFSNTPLTIEPSVLIAS